MSVFSQKTDNLLLEFSFNVAPMDLRKIRLFCEMTIGDLSRATGLSVNVISEIERGVRVDAHARGIMERFLVDKFRVEAKAELAAEQSENTKARISAGLVR